MGKRASRGMGRTRVDRPLYRVRRKVGNRFISFLLLGRSPKEASRKVPSNGGRILSAGKISREELLKMGDYFKLGEELMREFSQERQSRLASGPESSKEVVSGRPE